MNGRYPGVKEYKAVDLIALAYPRTWADGVPHLLLCQSNIVIEQVGRLVPKSPRHPPIGLWFMDYGKKCFGFKMDADEFAGIVEGEGVEILHLKPSPSLLTPCLLITRT